MASSYGQVRYKYRKSGTLSWAVTTASLNVNQPSEVLIMQKLREKHKGFEVELVDIKWK